MRQLRLNDLKHLPEVWRCFRRSRQPWSVLRRYLSPRHSGYPFELLLRNGTRIPVENFHDLVTAWVVNFREEYRVPRGVETVLDVGGNVGFFSLYAALQHPEARLIAVEPFPSTFARLAANVARNGLAGRVQCWNVGIAGRPGVRVMSTAGPSQSRGLLPADSACDGEGYVQTSVVTFEQLIRDACDWFHSETIDFVKVDIEGGEHEALRAAPPSAFLPIRLLGMEYHPNQPRQLLFDHLQSAGLLLVHDRAFGPDVGVAHFRRAEACRPTCGAHLAGVSGGQGLESPEGMK
jgi:FkbM family methyltransferase